MNKYSVICENSTYYEGDDTDHLKNGFMVETKDAKSAILEYLDFLSEGITYNDITYNDYDDGDYKSFGVEVYDHGTKKVTLYTVDSEVKVSYKIFKDGAR